jgi:hypothetical protein
MAVQRIEWQCPGCQRKFAIPNQQPRPKLCPNCQQNATAAQQRRPPAAATLPTPQSIPTPSLPDPDLDFADYQTDPAPLLPGPPSQPSRPVKRRRYEELRTISLWFKILAGLIAVVLLLTLYGIGKQVLVLPPGELKILFVFYWFVTVVSGVTVILLVYAFAVLLLVAMDIEYNTREE